MTDPTLPPDDEIVSAVLDGEATPAERARVEADPAAQARLAELQAARDRVAEPVPVPAEAREEAVAAALALFDQIDPAPSAGPRGPEWVPGDAHRAATPAPGQGGGPAPADELAARRAARRGRGGRWLVAAAAVVVLVIGVGAVVRALGDRSDLVASSSQTDVSDSSAGGAVVDEGGGAAPTESEPGPRVGPTTTLAFPPASAPETTAPTSTQFTSAPVALGSLASTRGLRDAMLEVIDERPDLQGGGVVDARNQQLAGVPCGPAVADDPEIAGLLATATADLQGEPVSVLAFAVDQQRFPAANGSVRIYAVEPTSCAVVAVITTR